MATFDAASAGFWPGWDSTRPAVSVDMPPIVIDFDTSFHILTHLIKKGRLARWR
jgi:hypothetical protein